MNVIGVIGPRESAYWRMICGTPQVGHDYLCRDNSRRIFQLFKDEQLVYEGYYVFNGDEHATGGEPLTEFGKPYAGCDRIRYRNIDSGEWEDLLYST